MVRKLLLSVAVVTAAGSAASADDARTDRDALTIYSTSRPGAGSPLRYRNSPGDELPGYAIVRHERTLILEKGRRDLRFTDVAARIDPTTVVFESLTDPAGTRVLEQDYRFDLVSQDGLLQRYLDRPVTVEQARGQNVDSVSGTLLSTQGGLVLREADGSVRLVQNPSGVKLETLPGGLMTRPTLVWDVMAKQAGPHRARVSYRSGGITWWADYNVTYAEPKSAGSCSLDVGAWVSIVNQSGAAYSNALLKLVAGDVQRLAARPAAAALYERRSMAMDEAASGFAEKAFFEYHLYTLGRATTLPNNSTKQIELFPIARSVPCKKTLVYRGLEAEPPGFGTDPLTDRNYGIPSNTNVDVYLSFKNGADQNLGMPLPAGRARVCKADPADRTLEFIGEDEIDHTPKDENVRLKLGSAFDVRGERKQIAFRVDTARKQMSEEIEIKVRNHKSEPVTVIVRENLYRWMNWRIERGTHRHQKQDARTVHFPVDVPPGGETALRYTVEYSW
jgi:hypothetical protein